MNTFVIRRKNEKNKGQNRARKWKEKTPSDELTIPQIQASVQSSDELVQENGSFHGCVDFLLVARVFFVSFSSYFCWIFMRTLFLRSWGICVQICWWGSCIDVLCIFVLDHEPSISRFGLRSKDFGWNASFLVEIGCDSILGDLVHLRAQTLGHIIP
jgi:hypothetical protein